MRQRLPGGRMFFRLAHGDAFTTCTILRSTHDTVAGWTVKDGNVHFADDAGVARIKALLAKPIPGVAHATQEASVSRARFVKDQWPAWADVVDRLSPQDQRRIAGYAAVFKWGGVWDVRATSKTDIRTRPGHAFLTLALREDLFSCDFLAAPKDSDALAFVIDNIMAALATAREPVLDDHIFTAAVEAWLHSRHYPVLGMSHRAAYTGYMKHVIRLRTLK